MIEVTDEMLDLLREYQMGAYGEVDDDCDKRMIAALIEMHEANKTKQEPVAWYYKAHGRIFLADRIEDDGDCEGRLPDWKPLYTTPPTREPLSEDFLMKLAEECTTHFFNGVHQNATIHFARAIEEAVWKKIC